MVATILVPALKRQRENKQISEFQTNLLSILNSRPT